MADNERLLLILEILNMSQSELADTVGCDRSIINRAIHNPELVTDNMKVKIAQTVTRLFKERTIDSRGLF
ncbi:MAG: hypothetical protein KJ583_01920 [Nanoarchaeota archaeon]|nr:hypothetical protein [Nanoarchaeota archaeon]MBU1269959.1 hypothetical protein [Nanoarchaeota archaeon]MBU1604050.1 hypothetical protein [Nanoarchaeota archaeon]MBU2442539.1 hypothetical protein [Nanoarchaeota archaeon]